MQNLINNDIYSKFEQQVVANKNFVAIESVEGSITYKDLEEKVSVIATSLMKDKNIVLEDVIGVMLPKSIEFIAYILAILKIGAVYLPMDLDLNAYRKKFILTNSNAKLLITSQTKPPLTSQTNHIRPQIQPDNIAYIIYTSGSTGQPKSVAVTHRGLLNLISQSHYSDVKKTGCNANFCFDISIFEIFFPLLTGTTLVLLDKNQILTKNMFAKNTQEIDMLSLSFPIFESLVKEGCNFNHIKYLLVGGEKFKPELLLQLHTPPKHLINSYGPTENTVISLNYEINKHDNIVPLGSPLTNTSIFVMNEKLELAHQGELLVAGENLARGYLNRPDLTAEKFIANPFGDGERLYKTGDLGRYLPDGNIEFLGRIDNQVKIRGFRIELGEIESSLNQVESIKTAVVLARENEDASKHLVAYIVPDSINNLNKSYSFKTQTDEEIDVYRGEEVANLIENARTKISEMLPEYMIPSHFVVVKKVPLTPNGKTDGKLLLTLDTGERISVDEYVAPRNEIERKLCEIWQEVLHIDKVGINDNFFKIGGDSILSIQVLSRAKRNNISFLMKDIFDLKTVRKIADKVNQDNALVPPERFRRADFPMTPWQSFLEKERSNIRYIIHECSSDSELATIRNNINKLNLLHKEINIRYQSGKQKYTLNNVMIKTLQIAEDNIDFTDFFDDTTLQVFLINKANKVYILIAGSSIILDLESFELITKTLLQSQAIQKKQNSFAQFVDTLYKNIGEVIVLDKNDTPSTCSNPNSFELYKICENSINLESIRNNYNFSSKEFFLAVFLISFCENEKSFSFLNNIRDTFRNFDFNHCMGNFDHIFFDKYKNQSDSKLMTQLTNALRTIKRSENCFLDTIQKCDLFFIYKQVNFDYCRNLLKNISDLNLACYDREDSLEISVTYNKNIYGSEKVKELIQKFIFNMIELIKLIDRDKTYTFTGWNESEIFTIVGQSNPDQKLFLLPPISGHAFPYLVLSDNNVFKKANIDVYAIGDLEFGYNMENCSNLVDLSLKFVDFIKEKISLNDKVSFAGWCFGGYLALEISRQFLIQNYKVNKMIMIDSPNPLLCEDMTNYSDEKIRNRHKFIEEEKVLSGTLTERKIIDNLKKNTYIARNYSPKSFEHPIEMILARSYEDRSKIDYWNCITNHINTYKTDLIHSEIFDSKNIDFIANLITKIIYKLE